MPDQLGLFTGEPWLMSRTLLNELITRLDALGGWPPESADSTTGDRDD